MTYKEQEQGSVKERTMAVIQKVLADNIPKNIEKPKSKVRDDYPGGADRYFLTGEPFMGYLEEQHHKNKLKESKVQKKMSEKAKVSTRKKQVATKGSKDTAAAPNDVGRKTREQIVAEYFDNSGRIVKDNGTELNVDLLLNIKKEKGAEMKMQKEKRAEMKMLKEKGVKMKLQMEKRAEMKMQKEKKPVMKMQKEVKKRKRVEKVVEISEDEEQMPELKKRKMDKVKVKETVELDDITDREKQ